MFYIASMRCILLAIAAFINTVVSTSSRKTIPVHYLPTSKRLSRVYTNAQLHEIGMRYDPANRIDKAELRKIKDPYRRARCSSPDREREVQKTGKEGVEVTWKGTGQTNAQYVEKMQQQKRKHWNARERRQQAERQQVFLETGVKPPSRSSITRKNRIDRVRSGDPNDVMLRGNAGRLIKDLGGMTNSAYMEQYKEKMRERGKSRYQRRKQRKIEQGLSHQQIEGGQKTLRLEKQHTQPPQPYIPAPPHKSDPPNGASPSTPQSADTLHEWFNESDFRTVYN